MTLTGTVEEIFDERQITDKFAIREFVLKTSDGQYPEHILFQCANQQIKLLDSVMLGESVTVHFNISGREANGRYWNSLKAWKIVADMPKQKEEQRNDGSIHRKDIDNNDDFKTDNTPVTEMPPLPPDNGFDDLPFLIAALIGISSIIFI